VTPGKGREFLPWVKVQRAVWVSPCYKAIYSLLFEQFAALHCPVVARELIAVQHIHALRVIPIWRFDLASLF